MIMLLNEAAAEAFLGRGTAEFAKRVSGHTIVNMGSMPPSYSKELDSEIRLAGGGVTLRHRAKVHENLQRKENLCAFWLETSILCPKSRRH